jgi:hypothetical protein
VAECKFRRVGNVQTNSSKLSNTRFAVLSAANAVLLTADGDIGEMVPMPMPRERPSNRLSKMSKSGEGASVVTT